MTFLAYDLYSLRRTSGNIDHKPGMSKENKNKQTKRKQKKIKK
jgi:hypothetical protein